jgi:hypothetical protein
MGNVGAAGARVGFICMTPAHLDKNGASVDHLTIHETDWAYCPSNVRTDGHEWKPTGGVSMGDLEILIRGMRASRCKRQRKEGPLAPASP